MRLSTCGSNKQSEMSSKHKCSKFVFLTCKCKGHFSAIAKARNNANNLQNDQSLLMMRDWWLGHQASFLILGENTPYFHITPQSFSRHWIEQQIWWEQFHAAFSTLYWNTARKQTPKVVRCTLLDCLPVTWMCHVTFKVGKTVSLGNLSKAKRVQGGNKLRVRSLFLSLQVFFFSNYSPVQKQTKMPTWFGTCVHNNQSIVMPISAKIKKGSGIK